MIGMMVGGEGAGVGRAGGLGTWLRRVWGWLTNTGYRPERRYMRGRQEA